MENRVVLGTYGEGILEPIGQRKVYVPPSYQTQNISRQRLYGGRGRSHYG